MKDRSVRIHISVRASSKVNTLRPTTSTKPFNALYGLGVHRENSVHLFIEQRQRTRKIYIN